MQHHDFIQNCILSEHLVYAVAFGHLYSEVPEHQRLIDNPHAKAGGTKRAGSVSGQETQPGALCLVYVSRKSVPHQHAAFTSAVCNFVLFVRGVKFSHAWPGFLPSLLHSSFFTCRIIAAPASLMFI